MTMVTMEAEITMTKEKEKISSNLHKRREHVIVAGRQDTQRQIVLAERRHQRMSGTCMRQ